MTMVDAAPQKHEEQYPLLKVDGGGGDNGMRTQSSTVFPQGLNVTCSPKQSWVKHWPDFISACWTTFILLGITFIVFCALGMTAYRRQSFLTIKCNSSKPATNVFYYHIVSQGTHVPFAQFSGYLSKMAVQYPNLNFNVHFLIDDLQENDFRVLRHSKFLNKLLPSQLNGDFGKYEDNTKRDIKHFQERYQNVYITTASLSKYMTSQSLRYKWRNIPSSYLPFYISAHAVYQHGGIGMDLYAFNDKFIKHQGADRKISAILKEHNDGIQIEQYVDMLNSIEHNEEIDMFTSFCELINQILNDTRSLFNSKLQFPSLISNKDQSITNSPVIRTHRSKREVSEENSTNGPENKSIDVDAVKDTFVTKTHNLNDAHVVNMTSHNTVSGRNITDLFVNYMFKNPHLDLETIIKPDEIKSNISNELEHSDLPVMYVYDFMISDLVGPMYVFSEPKVQPQGQVPSRSAYPAKRENDVTISPVLTVDPDGLFIASSTRLHPLLEFIINSACLRLHPKLAVDRLIKQCSGLFRGNVHCNNFFLI